MRYSMAGSDDDGACEALRKGTATLELLLSNEEQIT